MTKLNCDMGESFGIYRAGNDEEIMPLIDVANVACGFHAYDIPNYTCLPLCCEARISSLRTS